MQPSPLTGVMETSAQLGFAPHAGERGGSLKKTDTVMLVSAITVSINICESRQCFLVNFAHFITIVIKKTMMLIGIAFVFIHRNFEIMDPISDEKDK